MKRQIRKKINSDKDVELIIDPDEYVAPKPAPAPQPVPIYCVERPGIFTQSNGQSTAKTPEDMFDLEIPNDLKMVDSKIREYYGI